MNSIAKTLLSSAMLAWSTISHGYLMLDTKYLGSDKEFNQLSDTFQVSKFFENHEKKIESELLASAEIDPISSSRTLSSITWGAFGHARAVFNGREYYLRAFNYTTLAQSKEYDAAIASKRKSRAIPGGGACVLYVSDKDLNKVTSLRIDLPENNHGTWCNGVNGIGSAGKERDGVLIPLSYYLTDNTPAKQAKDIGEGWRYMTVFIRFSEVNGKLKLSQDDRCLGNPNKYKDIPSARKALTRCENQ